MPTGIPYTEAERTIREKLAMALHPRGHVVFPFSLAMEGEIATRLLKAPFYINATVSSLVLLTILFPNLRREFGIFGPATLLIISAVGNLIAPWMNGVKLRQAAQMDKLFTEALFAGEKDFSEWRGLNPDDPNDVRRALSLVERAKGHGGLAPP